MTGSCSLLGAVSMVLVSHYVANRAILEEKRKAV